MYGAVETRTSGGWLGHVSENGGYTVNVEYHVTGRVPDCTIGVRGGVVEQT